MKYRWLYNLVILALISYFWVPALFSLRSARSDQGPQISRARVPEDKISPAPLRPLEDYKIITERNLFGGSEEEETPVAEEISLEEVPLAQRSVGLKLVGTVVTNEPGENVAIIENQRDRKQGAYREGNEVNQIQIKRILRNNVIISMGTEEQRLTMDPEEDAASTPAGGPGITSPGSAPRLSDVYRQRTARSQRPRPTRRSAYRQRLLGSNPLAPGNEPGQSEQPESEANPPETGGDQPETQSGDTSLEQQELDPALEDTDKLMEEMQIKPYSEGDESAGFQIGRVKPGSIFAKMGLRSGDVVTGVNDEAVTGVEQAEDVYNSLLDGGATILEVKRGGRTQKLQIGAE